MTEKSKKQIDKFREAAREHETDESEENFARVLGKIAKAPKPADEKKRKDQG